MPFVVVFVLTLTAYLPAMNGGLLLGDAQHITRPALRPLEGLLRIWFEPGATSHYYPLLNTVFWIQHRLWGDAVLGYHLANILQHAFAACLVLAIVRRLELPGAFLAALLFALHPVCVESVAWISQQQNTLSAIFCLAAALFYVGFDRERIMWQYDVAFGFFLLGLLTKTTTATLPAALLAFFWWERGRLDWRRDVIPLLPWFAIGLGAGIFSAWFEYKFNGAHGADFALSFMERCLLAARALWFYFHTLFWPADLMLIQPRWAVDGTDAFQYMYLAGLLAIITGLAFFARRNRGPLAAFLIFTAMLFPALGFVNASWFRLSFVADHFQYLACLGWIVPVSVMLTRTGRRAFPSSRAMVAVAALLIVGLGAMTWRQSRIYRDAETLYQHTVARNPTAWLAHNHLGVLLEAKPDGLPAAIAHYRRAVELKPDYAPAHANLGGALARLPEQLPHALAAFETSLQLQSRAPDVRVRYANVLAQIPGRLPDAIAQFQEALSDDPDSALAHYHLGRTLARIPGRETEAIAAYETAIRLRPDFLDAYHTLADALAHDPRRTPDAIAAYEGALHLRPEHVDIRASFAELLARIPGRASDAAAEYEKILRQDPAHAEAHYHLGRLLASQPERRSDAAIHIEAALRLRPNWKPAEDLARSLRER